MGESIARFGIPAPSPVKQDGRIVGRAESHQVELPAVLATRPCCPGRSLNTPPMPKPGAWVVRKRLSREQCNSIVRAIRTRFHWLPAFDLRASCPIY